MSIIRCSGHRLWGPFIFSGAKINQILRESKKKGKKFQFLNIFSLFFLVFLQKSAIFAPENL